MARLERGRFPGRWTILSAVLFGALGVASGAWARDLARGRVGARKSPSFLWSHRVLRLVIRYDAGRIMLKTRKVVRFKSARKFFPRDGRFEILGFKGRKRVWSWRMDFPLLGRTAGYSRRDQRLMAAIQGRVRTQATVDVPWSVPVDRIVIVDRTTGKKSSLWSSRKGPMCRRASSARYRTRGPARRKRPVAASRAARAARSAR